MRGIRISSSSSSRKVKLMVDLEECDNYSGMISTSSCKAERQISNVEHRRSAPISSGSLFTQTLKKSGGGGEGVLQWGKAEDPNPIALLSNLGDALKSALNSIANDPIRKRRGQAGGQWVKIASINLQTGSSSVHDAPGSSASMGGADDFSNSSSRRPAARPKGGWFSEVGQARAFYKQISVVDRARIGAMAGGLAGGFTYCCLHPIDTIRTKLQTRGAAQVYKNALDVVVSTLKTKGIQGFYSGISAVLVGSVLSSGVYFGCIELGRSALVKYTSISPLLIPPLSGAFGNIVSSTILVPKEVITQRMQAGASGRSWHLVLRTVQNEGFRGLYAGYAAALVRNLPSSVISFTAFEYVKAVWLRNTGKRSLEPWQSVLSGAMAGAISSALTTPLDVVKTRLMTQAKKEVMGTVTEGVVAAELRAKIAASSYKGISSTLKQIWVEEGWIGLTKGMGPRLLHSAMFSALGYFAFETARVQLVKRHMAKLKLSETESQPASIIL